MDILKLVYQGEIDITTDYSDCNSLILSYYNDFLSPVLFSGRTSNGADTDDYTYRVLPYGQSGYGRSSFSITCLQYDSFPDSTSGGYWYSMYSNHWGYWGRY